MRSFSSLSVPVAIGLYLNSGVLADPAYQPCPLLRAYYLAPTIDKNSSMIQSFTKEFTSIFDGLIKAGGSEDFGQIKPNTTSFSVVLFSNTENAEDNSIFFEYHHTAPKTAANSTLFTVYSWLVEVGDEEWGTPITHFLPELKSNYSAELTVNWDDITIGALAGQMSGLARDSFACKLNEPCDRGNFVEKFSMQPPLFFPDTTPVISNVAFQLLALALEAQSAQNETSSFEEILSAGIFNIINMSSSGLLQSMGKEKIFAQDLDVTAIGEPAALSMVSTASDLAKAGRSMLNSRLISKGATRRWLQPIADTSNLRNGVGRPWEIYHAGQYANSSILDVFTKTGLIGHYASYFGLAPDFNAGFAILAHDAEAARGPDLNVYADIVSLAVVQLQKLAAAEMTQRYAGVFERPDGAATFNISKDGPGLVVSSLKSKGVDLRAEVAAAASIKPEDLDFRLYPSNVATENQHQFVAVFQDKSAPVDMGTPTCITWQDVGSLGSSFDVRVVFDMHVSGKASKVSLANGSLVLPRSG